jgi:hypothetical protein
MVLGMSLVAFTLLHVVISLVGIFTGFVVVYGMFDSKPLRGWTTTFLATTILTDVTGYLFPFQKVLPSHVVGGISLAILALALVALYQQRLARSWRWIYVAGAVTALYLNVFVAVVQAFLKIPALNALAPTQSDPVFIVTQAVVMVAFVAIGILASKSFHPVNESKLA